MASGVRLELVGPKALEIFQDSREAREKTVPGEMPSFLAISRNGIPLRAMPRATAQSIEGLAMG